MEKYLGPVFYNREGINFAKNSKELIMENIERILNTRRGERINNLYFGSDLKNYLFFPEIELSSIKEEIINSITRCEPRVEVVSVVITVENEKAKIDLVVRIIETNEITDLSLEV